MPYLPGDAGRIWFEQAGAGDPVTVFAHGVTSTLEEIRPLSVHTDGTRVLFDTRGHGRSDASDGADLGYAGVEADLSRVADACAATRAVGVSMGAVAILRSVARQPERYTRIVLLIPPEVDRPAPPAPQLADLLERMSLEQVADAAERAPEYQRLFIARPYWRALVRARILRMNRDGVPRMLRAQADAPPAVPDLAVLRAVRTPVLILAHADDPMHDLAGAERLARALPHAELRAWSEPLAMFDDLDALAGQIGRFLGH